ncbi:LuxR C-terminal-related transcriptional regulator [Streptomyces poriferorum]|uniref:LuxR C-terminal-related transcriptional regulator n=1 Tax=Streptomyces poriferorum TaxID=2798799 RepID=A0ABY9INP7_9ACTN|nr:MULTISPECIES: LuxR C-terminal-related transcriptional regulator [unclassified Streptomyces]MDP5315329.1 LuxR C-terminal-related transcriptional regulator [Streptomyces sp. Alt4]WLQ55812.1 LuxR C-terminal-related transcriptional regulator [Streptomyces sp. Alt2]
MTTPHTRRIALSNRQEDALQALADGKTRAEIAHGLGIQPNSLARCLSKARAKLGIPVCADTMLVAVACMSDAIWTPPPPAEPIRVPGNLRYLIAPVSEGMQIQEIAKTRHLPYKCVIADCKQLRRLMGARTSPHLVARLWQYRLAPIPP